MWGQAISRQPAVALVLLTIIRDLVGKRLYLTRQLTVTSCPHLVAPRAHHKLYCFTSSIFLAGLLTVAALKLIRAINHRTSVKPYDHFFTFCLRIRFIFIFCFYFLVHSPGLLCSSSSLFTSTIPVLLLSSCFFLLPVYDFSPLSLFFSLFSFYSYILLFFYVFFRLCCICFNLLLPSVLFYLWQLFAFPISFGFSKLSSLPYFPLFNNLYFKVCDIHTTSLSHVRFQNENLRFLHTSHHNKCNYTIEVRVVLWVQTQHTKSYHIRYNTLFISLK